MSHTQECQERTARIEAAIAEYKAKWPNYCRECLGQGVHTWSENQAPLGSGHYWPKEDSEPCAKCLERGICPRCGAQNGETWNAEQEEPCPVCGWNNGKDESDALPTIDECDCYLREEAAIEAQLEELHQESIIWPWLDQDDPYVEDNW